MSDIVKYDPQVVAAVINSQGDLSKLNDEARVQHYERVCHAVGLHASTQPFQYITLNRKLVLYAKKDDRSAASDPWRLDQGSVRGRSRWSVHRDCRRGGSRWQTR